MKFYIAFFNFSAAMTKKYARFQSKQFLEKYIFTFKHFYSEKFYHHVHENLNSKRGCKSFLIKNY